MSRAAELKKKGKESVFARRRREKEELEEMLRRNEEETTKEVVTKLKAEEAKKADEAADEAVKEVAKEATKDQKTDRQKLDGIKPQPGNKELADQIMHNTGLIGRLTDQIRDMVGGVEALAGHVGQHDQVLGDHGRRISALEKATGILDPQEATGKTGVECYPADPEPVKAEPQPQPVKVDPKPQPTKAEHVRDGSYFDYLYFPVDKYTGKTRWDLPFSNAVDAADCAISQSWKRRLFCFADGKVLREATAQEASKFSIGA